MGNLTTNKWVEADKAFAKGQQAYIELGQAFLKIDATQEEIGERYDMSQESVSHCMLVAGDKRIVSYDVTKLPKALATLYQLTTLNDDGFKELCRPDTTRQQVLDYKNRLKGPTSTKYVSTKPSTSAHAKPAATPTVKYKAVISYVLEEYDRWKSDELRTVDDHRGRANSEHGEQASRSHSTVAALRPV